MYLWKRQSRRGKVGNIHPCRPTVLPKGTLPGSEGHLYDPTGTLPQSSFRRWHRGILLENQMLSASHVKLEKREVIRSHYQYVNVQGSGLFLCCWYCWYSSTLLSAIASRIRGPKRHAAAKPLRDRGTTETLSCRKSVNSYKDHPTSRIVGLNPSQKWCADIAWSLRV